MEPLVGQAPCDMQHGKFRKLLSDYDRRSCQLPKLQCSVPATGCQVTSDDKCSCKTCKPGYRANAEGGCTAVCSWLHKP